MPKGIPGSRGTCNVVENGQRCTKPHYGRGMCNTHWARWRHHGDPLIVLPHRTSRLLPYLMECVRSRDRSTGCWRWENSCSPAGYGQIRVGYDLRLVSHIALEADGKPRPSPEQSALHSCDNPPCFNPDHLRWGTQQENSDDKLERGRSNRGERHGMAKLTADDVREIRRRVAAGEMQKSLVPIFGVSGGTISRVVLRKDWGWLD
ncbi:MAG TPA: HNH endonuclease [Acidimicrobiales bacterium]|nr:HNH endonuclease [Acidimicrobiales bacterium]